MGTRDLMRILILFLALVSYLEACTAFHLRSQDGALVYCRSLEFGLPMDSHILIVPRETAYTGTAPGSTKGGIAWKTKYGFVGLNQSLDRTLVSDGLNEKGLVVGMLYLPGYAKYETPNPARADKTLGAWELGTYLLSLCATVGEAKALLSNLLVAEQPTPGVNFSMPLHFYVGDNTGAVLIVEYLNGKKNLYDNPIGVLTNSPPFDWQMKNLCNYVNLSPFNAPPMMLGNWKVENYGQGSGSLGMPGDYTPPSRFVRASLYSHWATQAKTASECAQLGFHILNTFDIFLGAIQDKSKSVPEDTTAWVAVHDQTNLKTYVRSYESLSIEMVDLKKIDFGRRGLREIPLPKEFAPIDVTSRAINPSDKQVATNGSSEAKQN